MRKHLIVLLIMIMTLSLLYVGCNGNNSVVPDSSGISSDQNIDSSIGDSGSSGEDPQGGGSSEPQTGGTLYPEGLPQRLTILFQGDSITDNNRSREDRTDLGGGYAAMVAKALKEVYEGVEFTFINRAESGWKLIQNWNGTSSYQEQFYDYDADIATILIGYNDIMAHEWGASNNPYVSNEEFEEAYRALLQGLKERGTTAVCIAPFDITEGTEYRKTEFAAKSNIVKALAEEFSFPFIDMKPYMMQAVEDGAYKMELFGDLTHPWAAGNRIIAELVFDKLSILIDKDYETPNDIGAYRPLSATEGNEDDLTNCRAFIAISNGKAEYDTEVFCNTDETPSTQSLRIANEGIDPISINAYTKILFDYSSLGKKDLTKGTLSFNLKLENLQPWYSVYAVGGYTSGSMVSKPYGSDLNDSMKGANGWYNISINLESWAAQDTTGILRNSVGLIITTSKLENNELRERHGVDGKKISYTWVDNLIVKEESGQSGGEGEEHSTKVPFYAGQNFIYDAPEGAKAYSSVSFSYKIESTGRFNLFIYGEGWACGYGNYRFESYGSYEAYTGITCKNGSDGFIDVVIDLTKASKTVNGQPEQVSIFVIRGDWTDANGYIDNICFNMSTEPSEPSEPEEPHDPLGPEAPDTLPSKLTILFQGDSITDNNRNRSDLYDLGGGYAAMAAQALSAAYGDDVEFTFINQGHSGWNLIEDWNRGGVDHYEEQFYAFNADIATILIGYNDIMDGGGGVSDEDFESCYRALLQGLKDHGTMAICLAPFDVDPNNDYRRTEFASKREIIRSLAVEFNVPFIDMKPYMMQAVEDGAYKMELFGDITHPWAAACRIISELVVDKISKLIDKDYITPDDLGAYRPLSTTADNKDDLTNIRFFFATSQGKAEYDTEVFYNAGDITSSQSLKITHENPDPVQYGTMQQIAEQANSYSRALFDYSSGGKKDLTSGSIKFNLKMENFEPFIALQAYSALTNFHSNVSSSYVIYLDDTNQVTALGDGWYEINVDIASWASNDTTGVLSKSAAIVITASKGLTDQDRQNSGVDGKKPSYMWLDNLIIDVEQESTKEIFHAGENTSYLAPGGSAAYTTVSFSYKIESGEKMNIVILDNGGGGYGNYRFQATGAFENYNGITCQEGENGEIDVVIDLTKATKIWNNKPDTVNHFLIYGSWTDADGYVDNIIFA